MAPRPVGMGRGAHRRMIPPHSHTHTLHTTQGKTPRVRRAGTSKSPRAQPLRRSDLPCVGPAGRSPRSRRARVVRARPLLSRLTHAFTLGHHTVQERALQGARASAQGGSTTGLLRGPERGMRNFGRTRSKFAPFWVIRLVFSSFLYTRVNTRHCGGSAVPDFATATPVSGVCGGRRSREPATAREARRAGARERVRQLGLSWRGIGGPHNSDATAGKSAPTAANLTP